jgi:type II secretory pathway component PulJ
MVDGTHHSRFTVHGSRLTSGLTLLELLVALGLFVSLMALLLGAILQVTGLTHRGQAQAELQEGVTLALEQLSRELRAAAALRGDAAGLVATTLSGDPVVYRLDPHLCTLVRVDATGSHRLLPAPIEATTFYGREEGHLGWLTLAARHRPAANVRWQTYTATTAVTLRNEE